MRSHIRGYARIAGRPVQSAKVFFYEKGTTTALTDVYDAETGGNAITFDVTNDRGEYEAWKDTPAEIKVSVTDNANTAFYPGAVSSLLNFTDQDENIVVGPPVNAAYVPSYTLAGLPAASDTWKGRIAKLSDSTRGLTVDRGTIPGWSPLLPHVSVKDFGAKGDGVTNDTAAIQAALDTSLAVFFPAGTYVTTSLLAIGVNGGNTTIFGEGMQRTFLTNSVTDVFSIERPGHTLKDFKVTASGGHIFTVPAGIPSASRGNIGHTFERVHLLQNNGGKSAWHQTGGSWSSIFIDNLFFKCKIEHGTASATVPLWNIVSPIGDGGNVNNNTWEHCWIGLTTAAADHPNLFYIENADPNNHSYGNVFRGIIWENCNGTKVQLLGAFGTLFDNCWDWDCTTLTDYAYRLEKSATGSNTLDTTFISCGRASGARGAFHDVYVDASITTPRVLLLGGSSPTAEIFSINANNKDVIALNVVAGAVVNPGANSTVINALGRVKLPQIDGNLLFYGNNTYDIGDAAAASRPKDLYLAGAIKAGKVGLSLLFNAENTYDIGDAGATGRPRNVYIANNILGAGGGISGFPTWTGHLNPSANNSYDLASADATQWRTLRLSTSIRVGGIKVIGAQGAAVADATGGANIDAEARAAINALLARERAHGLIAT